MSEPTQQSRPGRATVWVVVAALGLLLLVALGASSPRPVPVEVLPRPTISADAGPLPVPEPAVSASESALPLPEQEPLDFPDWIGDVFRALVVASLVGVVGWFVYRLFGAVIRPERGVAAEPTGNAVDIPEIDDEELVDVVADAVASLRRGIAVEGAVVECWRRLEQVAADSGIVRRPTQTSQEFTVEVLGHAIVDSAALTDLAELYRQAMFSTHQLTDADRERAIDCLEALSSQLRREVPDES